MDGARNALPASVTHSIASWKLYARKQANFALLEYLGYPLYELGQQSVLDVMHHVGVNALMEAFHRHSASRTTRSLLFCVIALLDALDQDESLKNLGLHLKLAHDDPKLYLISHASLASRGLSVGQANVYQMLAAEHRLYIPFSLSQLLRDLDGHELPKVPYQLVQ